MYEQISPEQKRTYLANPNLCPSCGNDTPIIQDSCYDNGQHLIDFICRSADCDYKWTEEYLLTSVWSRQIEEVV